MACLISMTESFLKYICRCSLREHQSLVLIESPTFTECFYHYRNRVEDTFRLFSLCSHRNNLIGC
jgi:hypothetical protein